MTANLPVPRDPNLLPPSRTHNAIAAFLGLPITGSDQPVSDAFEDSVEIMQIMNEAVARIEAVLARRRAKQSRFGLLRRWRG